MGINPNLHLHFGGSLSKKGNLTSLPSRKKRYQLQRRYESIIRLEAAGFNLSAIAAMLCISEGRVKFYKKQPDFLAARVKLTHGIILDQEGQLSLIKEQRKEILQSMLPDAMRVIAETIQRRATTLAERKHQSLIAFEILDREGTLAKVSRTEIKPVDSFDFEHADKESSKIIQALRGASITAVITGSSSPAHSIKAVEANKEFSNSHTLSAVDQQAALDDLEAEALLLKQMPSTSESIQ